MDSTALNDRAPYFFLFTEQYTIGTPRGLAASSETIDIPFHDFAKNCDLQRKLGLLSSALIKPSYNPPITYPLREKDLFGTAAGYLSFFCKDPKERKKARDYLINGGLIRILITNNKLREEIRKVI